MHDFGLNLQKLIDIVPKEPSNILVEGTFGLLHNKTKEISHKAYDYKILLDDSIKKIEYMEHKIKSYPEEVNPEDWKLKEFLRDYKLVFHEYVPLAWQQKHRLEFVNELFGVYYSRKFSEILRLQLFGDSSNFSNMIDEFIKFKKLSNRINLKKFPIICILKPKEDNDEMRELIDYLHQNFEEKEFTLDVRTTRYAGQVLLVAIKNQDMSNYMGITLENYDIEAKLNFVQLNSYMDAIELYIASKYLR